MRFAVAIPDSEPKILAVNPAFSRITGWSADEVVGKHPRILSSGHHDAAFYKAMWGSLAERGFWEGEIWNRNKAGIIYPEWLSISTIDAIEEVQAALAKLAKARGGGVPPVVIGGRASGDVRLPEAPNVIHAESMGELAAFARGMTASGARTCADACTDSGPPERMMPFGAKSRIACSPAS